MNRGTLTGSWRGYTAKLEWNITQSQEENYSDLTCNLYLVCNSGYNIYTGRRNHSIFINNISYEIVSSLNSRGGEEIHLGSITKRIYHNADGTCNISLSAVLDVEANIRGTFLKRIDIPKFNEDILIRKAYSNAIWNGPSQGQIDPLKEANAAVIKINNGLSTRTKEVAELNGGDFEQNIRIIDRENKILEKKGVKLNGGTIEAKDNESED